MNVIYMMEEEFKIIENYQNYKVSNFGKVCNVRTGRILTPKIGSSCFLNVNLFNNGFGKSFTVHSLVAKNFIKNKCDYPCIMHIDDNKLNNNASNLKYCEYSDLHKKIKPKEIKSKITGTNTLTIYFD